MRTWLQRAVRLQVPSVRTTLGNAETHIKTTFFHGVLMRVMSNLKKGPPIELGVEANDVVLLLEMIFHTHPSSRPIKKKHDQLYKFFIHLESTRFAKLTRYCFEETYIANIIMKSFDGDKLGHFTLEVAGEGERVGYLLEA